MEKRTTAMFKEMIDRLLELAPTDCFITSIDGRNYAPADKQIRRIVAPHEHVPAPLIFNTLQGLADYLNCNPDGLDLDTLTIHVVDFDKVSLIGPLQPGNDNTRFCYASAVAETESFRWGRYMTIEDMIVGIQTGFAMFEDDNDAGPVLELIGNVASEKIHKSKDDGVFQVVEVRTGLTTKAKQTVANPVRLYPWRTFAEIKQPLVLSILRFSRRTDSDSLPEVALIQTESKTWKLTAIERVRAWIKNTLPEVTVIA
jgi:hypothetical protein